MSQVFYAPSNALVQFLKIFCFFSKFGNLTEERCRRNLETVISMTTFIVNFTVCCLFYCCFFFVFRKTPACALIFVVYEKVIHFLLPNR